MALQKAPNALLILSLLGFLGSTGVHWSRLECLGHERGGLLKNGFRLRVLLGGLDVQSTIQLRSPHNSHSQGCTCTFWLPPKPVTITETDTVPSCVSVSFRVVCTASTLSEREKNTREQARVHVRQ